MAVTMDYAADLVLKEAEKLLLEGGWCQHTYWKTVDNKRYYCALGALSHAQLKLGYGYGNLPMTTASKKLALAVGKEHDGGWLSCWNDEPTRTKEEVLEAFKKAQEL